MCTDTNTKKPEVQSKTRFWRNDKVRQGGNGQFSFHSLLNMCTREITPPCAQQTLSVGIASTALREMENTEELVVSRASVIYNGLPASQATSLCSNEEMCASECQTHKCRPWVFQPILPLGVRSDGTSMLLFGSGQMTSRFCFGEWGYLNQYLRA